MRRLAIESLDPRLCMAFGDVDTSFAQSGEYLVSYGERGRQYASIVSTLDVAGGYLHVSNATAGGGALIAIAKTDDHGVPDPSFGNGGLVRLTDPSTPRAQVTNVLQLSDGSLLFRTRSPSTISYLKLTSQGALDSSFGEAGFLHQTENYSVYETWLVADKQGGYLVISSDAQTMFSRLQRFQANGQIDTSFGDGGLVKTTRLTNVQLSMDDSGKLTILGQDTLSNLDVVVYRFLSDGTPDTQFATSGLARLPGSNSLLRYELLDQGTTVLEYSLLLKDGTQSLQLTRYSIDLILDDSFGQEGTVTVEIGPLHSYYPVIHAFPRLQGYQIVSTETSNSAERESYATLVGLLHDGQVDTAFGEQGRKFYTFSKMVFIQGLQLDDQERLLLTGPIVPLAGSPVLQDTSIVRIGTNGQLDPTWGTNGIRNVNYTPPSQRIDLLQLAPTADNQMRLTSGWPGVGSRVPLYGRVDRLDSDGNVVQSAPFGGVETPYYSASAPAPDGGWYVAKTVNDALGMRIEIRRFLPDGTLNKSFAEAGVMTFATNQVAKIFMRAGRDGSVAMAADTIYDSTDPASGKGAVVVARISPDGTPDTTFAPGGVLQVYETTAMLADVLTDPLVGTVLVSNGYNSAEGIKLVAYDAHGQRDERFGEEGVAVIPGQVGWRAGEIDELGRIVLVSRAYVSLDPYVLQQLDSHGQPSTSFGDGGSVILPIDFDATFDEVSMSLQRGVIAIAAAHQPMDNVVRLLAYDYAGQLMPELDNDGIKDFDLATDGVTVGDLAFAEDGSLWLATALREGFDMLGSLIKLEGSSSQPLHNWSNSLDVSGDGQVTPLDALLVISWLNGNRAPSDALLDANADTRITAIDALLIINQLNSPQQAAPMIADDGELNKRTQRALR